MEAIKEKAVAATGTFLERRGFEILERGWAHGDASVDYIARDEGDLVFVTCLVGENDGTGFPKEEIDRKANERLAIAYLAEHPESGDCAIRFDTVSLVVVADNRALLRHHRNALCAVE